MDVVNISKALGNETRYKIITALRNHQIITCCNRISYNENGVSVLDVMKVTGLSQSTVSQHMAVLEKAGLVYKEKRDTWSCYFLNEITIQKYIKQLNVDLIIKDKV